MENKVEIVSCETLMTTEYPSTQYCVETLIGTGCYIVAGVPKIGKSKLALDLCVSIAKGEKAIGLPTSKGAALYLALEDPYKRLQNRLYELLADPVENLFFCIKTGGIGGGLEKAVEDFYEQHKDLKLVIVDTFQKVRQLRESSYATDYQEVSAVKELADKLGITIILIHHLRKQHDKDPFNMISGTTGIRGCVDGAIVLIMKDEYTHTVTLHAEGRDIANRKMELQLDKDTQRWKLIADDLTEPEHFDDEVVTAIAAVIKQEKSFLDTTTVLTEKVNSLTQKQYEPRMVSRIMTQNQTRLEALGILFERRHSNGKRKLSIEYIDSSADGDDSDDETAVGIQTDSDPCANPLPA